MLLSLSAAKWPDPDSSCLQDLSPGFVQSMFVRSELRNHTKNAKSHKGLKPGREFLKAKMAVAQYEHRLQS